VPGIKHAKQLVLAIKERLEEVARPQVIVNRFEQRMFGPGLRRSDVEQAFGADLAITIPNHYRLVREAIDRGVPLDEVQPGNKITQELKKLIMSSQRAAADPAVAGVAAPQKKLRMSWAQ
jgi:pilus assembly protein CpaE